MEKSPGNDTIAARFFRVADAHAEKRAIWCDGEELSYKEFASLVCRYADYLRGRGVMHGENIGIPMNNSIESVALFLAAAVIGAGLVPINPTLPSDAVEAAFVAGDVKHLIARKAFYQAFGGQLPSCVTGCRLCLDADVEGADSFDAVLCASAQKPDLSGITGEETLILTMTSGSTGEPKPIELTQGDKLKRIDAHKRLYGITSTDNVLAATPLYHSLAERLVLMPLLIGATSILLARFTPVLWLDCVKEQRVTFTIAVSAQLSQIAQLLSSPFVPEISSLRTVVSSSALLESHVRSELIEKLDCDLHEMYGTSECSTVTDIDLRESKDKLRSVGRPLPGVRVRIVDESDAPVPIGEIGEITVRTPLRCASYYKMPEKMEMAVTHGYFHTGDLGMLDEDGYLYFAGRKKEIINTGGVNVYPKDIEEKVNRLEGVKECAAFAYADERLGEVVALAVVADEGAGLTKKEIQYFCARNLADFQQPHKIFFLKRLPENAMGKLVRHRILEAVAGIEE